MNSKAICKRLGVVPDRIEIKCSIDGYKIAATGRRTPEGDWDCFSNTDGAICRREGVDRDQDIVDALMDMIDYALADRRSEDAFIAGPFSTAQCR